MRKIFFVIFILLLFSPPSMGDTKEIKRISEFTGIEWGVLPKEWKMGYVAGWVMAGVCGEIFIDSLHENLNKALEEQGIKLEESDKNGMLTRFGFFKKQFTSEHFMKYWGIVEADFTIGQVIETIDQVYSDPRVKKWKLDNILPMVRGRLKDGWTLKDLDEVISYRIKTTEIDKKLKSPNLSEKEKKALRKEKIELELNEPKVLEGGVNLTDF